MVPEGASSHLCCVTQLPAPWTDTKKGQDHSRGGDRSFGCHWSKRNPWCQEDWYPIEMLVQASPLDAVAMPLSGPITSDTRLSLLVAMSELPGRASCKPGCHHGTARESLGTTCAVIWLGKGMGSGHPH